MTGPARHLAPDDTDQGMRLARFRAVHPEVVIGDLGYGGIWQARIPEENGETVITRRQLSDLLDRLSVIYPDLPSRATPTPPGGAR